MPSWSRLPRRIVASAPHAVGSAPAARRARPLLFGLGVIALAYLTRLPQLLSPQLALDGDEAIAGLMARHLLAGDELPLFFYGQSYGLSVPATLSVAGAFAALGATPLALKLGASRRS